MKSEQIVRSLLEKTGVIINGSAVYDMQVRNEALYDRILAKGSLGLGEAYIDGWWDVERLDEFFYRILKANLRSSIRLNMGLIWSSLRSRVTNLALQKPFEVGERHYDAGNDLFRRMLDRRLTYSCGYWAEADTLDAAQEAKLDLVCRKVHLKKDEQVLDIGCGWGSFLTYASEKYDVWGTGLTISAEQQKYVQSIPGLPFEVLLTSYQQYNAKRFDKIVSIGMFEHVGYKNYRMYMEKVRSLLRDNGLFLLHTIGRNMSVRQTDPWIQKYVFPNGMIPSASQISQAYEGLLVMEDWHNFGHFYDRTLMAWFRNFESVWPELEAEYGTEFYRMWKYHLLSCAGAFRARELQLWQIVLSKDGVNRGYTSVR